MKLNIGSGNKPQTGSGWVNVDAVKLDDNIVHDLNQYPWPFDKGVFTEVRAMDVLEHLDNPVEAVNEMIRVCKVGGTITVQVPNAKYPEYVWTDPQHKRGFSTGSLDFWVKGHKRELASGISHHHGMYFITDLHVEEINKNLIFTFRGGAIL